MTQLSSYPPSLQHVYLHARYLFTDGRLAVHRHIGFVLLMRLIRTGALCRLDGAGVSRDGADTIAAHSAR